MEFDMKKLIKIILVLILIVVVIAAAYFAYVFFSWHRLGDDIALEVKGASTEEKVPVGESLRMTSWNIGFGAYEDDYGFFMDGGTQSWAWSKERLMTNLSRIAAKLTDQRSDIAIVQEVDTNGTRTYHVDERDAITAAFYGYQHIYAQNYDSPFLFYPITQPHGSNKAGIMTFSRFEISSAVRKELPIEDSLMKLLDLDRCYSKSRMKTSNGKELIVYNFHLSAYTSDGTIANEQLRLLLEDIQAEYEQGNYCIAGGDFNKDILGDSSKWFGKSDIEYSWAQPIPDGLLDKYSVKLIAPLDEKDPVPSCRNADGPYHQGQYVLTIDGFMVTDNIDVEKSAVVDYQFKFSDHNPVEMNFKLK